MEDIKLIVFDLDDTLWYPEMYMLAGPPFRKQNGRVLDSSGTEVELYPDVVRILNTIRSNMPWCKIAYASRTYYPESALECMRLFEVDINGEMETLKSIADYWEIYPANKTKHLKSLMERSRVDYEEILFFDNERRNITDVSRLGVKCVYTPDGMHWKYWERAFLTK